MILGRRDKERCREHAVKAFKYNKLLEICDGDPEDYIRSLQKRKAAYKSNYTKVKNSLDLLKEVDEKKDEEIKSGTKKLLT